MYLFTNFQKHKLGLFHRAVEQHPEFGLIVGVSDHRMPGQGGLWGRYQDLSEFWNTYRRLEAEIEA